MPWQSLGEVAPKLTEWREYAPTAQDVTNPIEGLIYRFTPGNLSPGDKFKSFALVRFRFDDMQTESFTRSFRIYPYPGSVIQVVPIPPGMSIFPFSWIPQVRKFVYPRWRGRSDEPAWTVKVEDFFAPPDESPASIEARLAALETFSRFSY